MQSFSISCGVLHSSSSAAAAANVGAPLWSQWKWRVLPKRNSAKKRVRPSKVSSKLELNPLPYPLESLEPHMSKETLEQHWGRHHREHVEGLNSLIEGSDLDGMELEDIMIASYNKGNLLPPFNHAAQTWNHNFFWQSMKPGGGGRPSGALLSLIDRDFGSFEGMLREFKRAASTQFGSGWAWLVYKANKLDVGNAVNPLPSEEDNKLVVVKSPNAVNPLVWDYSPLVAIDVWEHAYYLDYENRRDDYVTVFLENLVSWEIVSSRLEMAIAKAASREREDARRSEDDDMLQTEATEVYLDSESDESEAD